MPQPGYDPDFPDPFAGATKDGIMLIGWSTALIIEILRRSGSATAKA